MKQLRGKVGLVFQYPEHQLFEVDVLTDVCFGPKNQGLPKEEVENNPELKKYEGKIVIGFGIGIPKLSNQETKYVKYTLNKIAIEQIFDGEEDWSNDDYEGDD